MEMSQHETLGCMCSTVYTNFSASKILSRHTLYSKKLILSNLFIYAQSRTFQINFSTFQNNHLVILYALVLDLFR